MNQIDKPSAFAVNNLQAGEARMDVASQWAARPADQRFLSLSDMHAKRLADAQGRQSVTIDATKVEVIAPEPRSLADTHRLAVGLPDGTVTAPTNWAFNQLAQRVKAPAAYLRRLPSQIVADNLNWGLRRERGEEGGLGAYHDNASGGQLHALTGAKYGRIFDHEVIAAVQQVAGNGTGDARWKVPGVMDWSTMVYDPDVPVSEHTTTLFASDRDMFVFLVDDKNPIEVGKVRNPKTGALEPDVMFRGFYVTNSEVGNSSLKLAAFYLRGVCCNRILWGVEQFQEVTMRHSSRAPSRFVHETTPALRNFAEGSAQTLIEGVQAAKAAKLASDDDDALAFLRGRGFSKAKAAQIFERVEIEEGTKPRTVWDFAQGITAAARAEINTDTRFAMEGEARKILDKVA
ncbi:MAG: DUF932 domain-containing protein [Pseudomonadota bacterium]